MTGRVVRAAAAVGLLAVALAATPTAAQETEISGQVESVIELSLTRAAPDRIEAAVSATVPGTQLTVSEPGRLARTLGAYRGPMTNARVTVRSASRRSGVTHQTITLGPQSP